ncbi:MAG: hypothetical protein ACP5NX_02105 [Candidatus Bilamarchaeaceae archaeon]
MYSEPNVKKPIKVADASVQAVELAVQDGKLAAKYFSELIDGNNANAEDLLELFRKYKSDNGNFQKDFISSMNTELKTTYPVAYQAKEGYKKENKLSGLNYDAYASYIQSLPQGIQNDSTLDSTPVPTQKSEVLSLAQYAITYSPVSPKESKGVFFRYDDLRDYVDYGMAEPVIKALGLDSKIKNNGDFLKFLESADKAGRYLTVYALCLAVAAQDRTVFEKKFGKIQNYTLPAYANLGLDAYLGMRMKDAPKGFFDRSADGLCAMDYIRQYAEYASSVLFSKTGGGKEPNLPDALKNKFDESPFSQAKELVLGLYMGMLDTIIPGIALVHENRPTGRTTTKTGILMNVSADLNNCFGVQGFSNLLLTYGKEYEKGSKAVKDAVVSYVSWLTGLDSGSSERLLRDGEMPREISKYDTAINGQIRAARKKEANAPQSGAQTIEGMAGSQLMEGIKAKTRAIDYKLLYTAFDALENLDPITQRSALLNLYYVATFSTELIGAYILNVHLPIIDYAADGVTCRTAFSAFRRNFAKELSSVVPTAAKPYMVNRYRHVFEKIGANIASAVNGVTMEKMAGLVSDEQLMSADIKNLRGDVSHTFFNDVANHFSGDYGYAPDMLQPFLFAGLNHFAFTNQSDQWNMGNFILSSEYMPGSVRNKIIDRVSGPDRYLQRGRLKPLGMAMTGDTLSGAINRAFMSVDFTPGRMYKYYGGLGGSGGSHTQVGGKDSIGGTIQGEGTYGASMFGGVSGSFIYRDPNSNTDREMTAFQGQSLFSLSNISIFETMGAEAQVEWQEGGELADSVNYASKAKGLLDASGAVKGRVYVFLEARGAYGQKEGAEGKEGEYNEDKTELHAYYYNERGDLVELYMNRNDEMKVKQYLGRTVVREGGGVPLSVIGLGGSSEGMISGSYDESMGGAADKRWFAGFGFSVGQWSRFGAFGLYTDKKMSNKFSEGSDSKTARQDYQEWGAVSQVEVAKDVVMVGGYTQRKGPDMAYGDEGSQKTFPAGIWTVKGGAYCVDQDKMWHALGYAGKFGNGVGGGASGGFTSPSMIDYWKSARILVGATPKGAITVPVDDFYANPVFYGQLMTAFRWGAGEGEKGRAVRDILSSQRGVDFLASAALVEFGLYDYSLKDFDQKTKFVLALSFLLNDDMINVNGHFQNTPIFNNMRSLLGASNQKERIYAFRNLQNSVKSSDWGEMSGYVTFKVGKPGGFQTGGGAKYKMSEVPIGDAGDATTIETEGTAIFGFSNGFFFEPGAVVVLYEDPDRKDMQFVTSFGFGMDGSWRATLYGGAAKSGDKYGRFITGAEANIALKGLAIHAAGIGNASIEDPDGDYVAQLESVFSWKEGYLGFNLYRAKGDAYSARQAYTAMAGFANGNWTLFGEAGASQDKTGWFGVGQGGLRYVSDDGHFQAQVGGGFMPSNQRPDVIRNISSYDWGAAGWFIFGRVSGEWTKE